VEGRLVVVVLVVLKKESFIEEEDGDRISGNEETLLGPDLVGVKDPSCESLDGALL